MRWLAVLLLLLCAIVAPAGAIDTTRPSALVLADETVRFDNSRPMFTSNQLANSSAATRDGLARWAATHEGEVILARLRPAEYAVIVTEDASEPGAGRTPQPGIATLAAAADHSKLKVYEIVMNPAAFHPVRADVAVVPPLTAADLMALAWAAEMLHVDYYARGISLPHHRRDDFQRQWHTVATELGMPNARHDDAVDDQSPPVRRPSRRDSRFRVSP